jgi:hypothetical protein
MALMLTPSAAAKPRWMICSGKSSPLAASLRENTALVWRRNPWWPLAASDSVRGLHRTIKKALDPRGILNPGKFIE